MKAPGIGAMRARLTLDAPVDMPDDTGGFVRSWTTIAQVWGRIAPQRADRALTADAIETAISHVVTIRARGDIANGMRFTFGARQLLIRAVLDPDGRGRIFECRCEEFAP
jgi:SPP1 family predicted phage head-tail adaptor